MLVFLGAATLPAAVTGALALAVAGVRWSTTSLAAVAGAQAVLGPAVSVGSATEAVAVGLAAIGAVLAAPPPTRSPLTGLTAAVLGLVAATVAVAPAGSGGLAPRLAALAVGAVAGVAAGLLPAERARGVAGVGCGAVGLALAVLAG